MPQLPAMNEEKMDALLGVGLENLLHWAQLLFSLRWLALAHVLHAVVPWPFIFLLALLPAHALRCELRVHLPTACARRVLRSAPLHLSDCSSALSCRLYLRRRAVSERVSE